MRKNKILFLTAVMATDLALTGCIYSHHAAMGGPVAVAYPTHTVVVSEAPPAPRTEVVGVAPDDMHVWIPGYWARSNNNWAWVAGHWEARPRINALWVPGRWDKNPDGPGWTWTPGHWD